MIKASSALLLIATSLFAVACSGRSQPAPVVVEPKFLTHEVKYSGETLGVIAAWYTGKTANWPMIEAANPGLKPTRIRLGDLIQIPEELVVKSDPLPKSAVPVAQPVVRDEVVVPVSQDSAPAAVEEIPAASTEVAPATVPDVQPVGEAEPVDIYADEPVAAPVAAPVAPVEPPAASTLGELQDKEAAAEAAAPQKPAGTENEREQLLNELLAE